MATNITMNVSVTNNISQSIARIKNEMAKLPEEAYKKFKATTPIRTGNARRNTRLDKGKSEIQATYPYATRLDEGYSQQAPQGMTKPTEDFIKKRVKQILRKK
jgi:hypothetical protein